ncbi:MAG: hypothetical protein ACREL6_11000, partial [Gemmatimonadales bacterium]
MKPSIWWVLLLVLLALLLLGWCGATRGPGPLDQSQRRECPHDWGERKLVSGSSLVGPIADIPEFHDCQRFIVEGVGEKLRYDSLFAIFASFKLDTLGQALDSAEEGQGKIALGGALIYTIGGRYPALGIKDEYTCLYLFHDPADSHWRAVTVPDPTAECVRMDPDVLAGAGKELEVRPITWKEFTANEDYPPVARWDWDSVHREQYIGIKCGLAWCEVGDSGFVSSPSYRVDPSEPYKLRRTHMIKGWYDEQLLAEPGPGGNARPTKTRGTLFPDAALNDHDATKGDFQTSNWVPVATLAMEDPLPVYKTRLNIDQALPTGSLNRMSLC